MYSVEDDGIEYPTKYTYQRQLNVADKATNNETVVYLDFRFIGNSSEFLMRNRYNDRNIIIVIAIPINNVGENNNASEIIEKYMCIGLM